MNGGVPLLEREAYGYAQQEDEKRVRIWQPGAQRSQDGVCVLYLLALEV
jgi:hypothetical protein